MAILELQIGGKLYADVEAGLDQLGRDITASFDLGLAKASPLLLQSLQKVTDKMVQMHGRGWNGSVVNSTGNLQSRSGGGLRSLLDTLKVSASRGEIVAVGEIGGGKLSFHEEGGTIRATRAKYLTIPLPAAMDPRGVPLRKRARDWDRTFVRRSRAGNLIIFRRLPGARELTPLYILKPSVYIRPRLKLEYTLMEELTYYEDRLLNEISAVIDDNL